MLLGEKIGNYSYYYSYLKEHTNTQGGEAHSQPARKKSLLRMRETSIRKLLLVTPTNRSPLLCPRVNVLPHRTKSVPHCTRIFSWSVDSTYGELWMVDGTKTFSVELRHQIPTVHSWRQTAFCVPAKLGTWHYPCSRQWCHPSNWLLPDAVDLK